MRRDSYRDAATLAFVRYGELRGLTAEGYKEALLVQLAEDYKVFDEKASDSHISDELRRYSGFFDDLYAVEETFGFLMERGKDYIVDAVRAVYMTYPYRVPSHRETVYKVRSHAIEVPVSEKQVYKWLEIARDVYSRKRGLAMDAPDGFAKSK